MTIKSRMPSPFRSAVAIALGLWPVVAVGRLEKCPVRLQCCVRAVMVTLREIGQVPEKQETAVLNRRYLERRDRYFTVAVEVSRAPNCVG